MDWNNRLIKKATLDSPVAEQTPVVWNDRLYLVETWQTHWDGVVPKSETQNYARVRDEESNEVISEFMHGYTFASGFVWEKTLYVFGSQLPGHGKGKRPFDLYASQSRDLTHWSEPRMVLEGDPGERLLNESVCFDGNRFVMAYESKTFVPFTLKFAESDDLEHWRKVPDAIYGPDKYAACPAIRHVGGYYYMLYVENLKPRRWFETYLTRSKDLIKWEDAPHNPVIAPDPSHPLYPTCPPYPKWDCPAKLMECNASDPDLVEWQGKVRVYFTGGCQYWGGYLQYAEFDGSMQDFFESYYD